MSPEVDAVLYLFLRWMHIASGITWIGHLYFLNFVNAPLQETLDAEARAKFGLPLLARALSWFRWGAMSTFVFGWSLFYQTYMEGGALWTAEHELSQRGAWMIVGALLGTLMWLNVWLVIWPAQKTVLGEWRGGPPAPPAAALRARRFSRLNVWLSGPMLMAMIAAPNVSAWSLLPAAVHVAVVLGTLVVIHLLFRLSRRTVS